MCSLYWSVTNNSDATFNFYRKSTIKGIRQHSGRGEPHSWEVLTSKRTAHGLIQKYCWFTVSATLAWKCLWIIQRAILNTNGPISQPMDFSDPSENKHIMNENETRVDPLSSQVLNVYCFIQYQVVHISHSSLMQHAEKTSHNWRVYCAFICRR